MKIGAQLYTVREFCQTADDLDYTLGRIAAIGYEYVQVSGVGQDITAHEIRSLCDKHALAIPLTHPNPARVRGDTGVIIEEHKTLGCTHIGIGCMPQEYMGCAEGVRRFIVDYMPAAKELAVAGMRLHYHNHHFEFEKFDGKLVIETLMEGFPAELMGFIPDTYWIQAGGGDVVLWLSRLAGRMPTAHLKDMGVRDKKAHMCEVLDGNLNWPAIFEAFKKGGTEYLFVEQDSDFAVGAVESLERSFNNLTAARDLWR